MTWMNRLKHSSSAGVVTSNWVQASKDNKIIQVIHLSIIHTPKVVCKMLEKLLFLCKILTQDTKKFSIEIFEMSLMCMR